MMMEVNGRLIAIQQQKRLQKVDDRAIKRRERER